MKTFGFGQIDWTGLKSVLIHSAWVVGMTLAFTLLNAFTPTTSIQIIIVGVVSSFLKKLCETYNVEI